MVRVATKELSEIRRQMAITKNAVSTSVDHNSLYKVCKDFTNFLEKVAREHGTTVNGVQAE